MICATTIIRTITTTVSCIQLLLQLFIPDKTCPTGMEYRECGPLCPYTCDSFFGRNPCFSLRCAPAGCYCPENYVMADGQCTPAQVACQGKELGSKVVDIWPKIPSALYETLSRFKKIVT